MTTPPTISRRNDAGHAQAAVELRGVSRHYGDRHAPVRALDGVSLACAPGSWTAVMGPSGSGKSTLLHCAAGLERPDAGQVLLGDDDITGASDRTLTELRRHRIGFVFQSFNLLGSLTAEQNVALPLRLAGRKVARADVRQVLANVGLDERRKHRPRELSGGQQQRVAIARAMVTRPAVLFADEPTGALDTTSARQVLRLLRDLVDTGRQTIVMVTHDPAAAASADSVVFLRDGRIVDHAVGPSAATVAERLARLEDAASEDGGACGAPLVAADRVRVSRGTLEDAASEDGGFPPPVWRERQEG